MRHRLVSLLAVTVAAVVAGARSFAAVAERVADASPQVMASLEVRWDPLSRSWEPPGEATIRRVLEQVDPEAFDAAAASWLVGQLTGPATTPRPTGRRVLAVDGKSLRGTRHYTAKGTATHLLSVLDQAAQATLRQVEVDGKSNEITALRPLLQPLDLEDVIVTADAQHTQRDAATFLVEEKNAH
ncbi:DDE family transposase [Actinocorallia herbida]|uniref:DDE family transposase n=1 Tax=Actinocorallia herbida TaxID=58109 RepID=A0A3N1D406_9ACTN|nr:DDE family transposase [Actinocorallia herbida]